jgi:cation diffusion facilitator family transporter
MTLEVEARKSIVSPHLQYGSIDVNDEETTTSLTRNFDTTQLSVASDHGSVTSCDDSARIIAGVQIPSLRKIAIWLSLYVNIAITFVKLVAYFQTYSLSVLAALLDSVLDVVSQLVLNYTEKHSSLQRSSAFYPAGASRLEPIGVLTCAALMGMASFEVLKESLSALIFEKSAIQAPNLFSFYNMLSIVLIKLFLLLLCNRGANKKVVMSTRMDSPSSKHVVQLTDPTLEALSQDHFNDALSNSVAAVALLFALKKPSWWYLDPVGAIIISIYIIYSWYVTGKEQIEHLTGMVAPEEFRSELAHIASSFDDRLEVDHIRVYHFG